MLRCLQSRLFSTLKIPIEAIKKLREETSAPIGQCKTALEESNGDHKAAMAWLKKKGLGQADKRVDKETRQGVIGAMVTQCRSKFALCEVNSETDFVAKNELVLNFAYGLMARAIQCENPLNLDKQPDNKQPLEAFLNSSASTDLFPEQKQISNMSEELKIMISRLQQNIRVRRLVSLHSDAKKFGVYVHQGYNEYVGLQAAIVQFQVEPELDVENEDQLATFSEFADNIATQIVGSTPKYLRQDQIPAEQVDSLTAQVKEQLKDRLEKAPEHARQKMVKGKLASHYQQILLPKMAYVLSNNGTPVEQYWKEVESELNRKITITNTYHWSCK